MQTVGIAAALRSFLFFLDFEFKSNYSVRDRKMIFIQHEFMPPLKLVLHLGKSTRISLQELHPTTKSEASLLNKISKFGIMKRQSSLLRMVFEKHPIISSSGYEVLTYSNFETIDEQNAKFTKEALL